MQKRPGFLFIIIMLFGVISMDLFADEFKQPVEFSHKTHADTNEIPCEFCHTYARRSINSGAPSMQNCNGCHSVIKGSDEKKQEEIRKVAEFWNNQKSIPWKKIHDVPDFVIFSHKRHIQAGFDCSECHGNIDQLDVITTQSMITDLSMGWCVKCHDKPHPSVDGKIISASRKTRGGKIIKEVLIPDHNDSLSGSKDCYICHK